MSQREDTKTRLSDRGRRRRSRKITQLIKSGSSIFPEFDRRYQQRCLPGRHYQHRNRSVGGRLNHLNRHQPPSITTWQKRKLSSSSHTISSSSSSFHPPLVNRGLNSIPAHGIWPNDLRFPPFSRSWCHQNDVLECLTSFLDFSLVFVWSWFMLKVCWSKSYTFEVLQPEKCISLQHLFFLI